MKKNYIISLLIIACVMAADQGIKWLILSGFRFESEAISITLVYNDGVAFSMLSFLKGYLKWIQIIFLGFIIIYIYTNSEILQKYYLGFSFIFGGGISNILDRFIHGGVVDYVYWHYWFEFAIFNFADVMIDLGVFILLLQWLWLDKRKNLKLKEKQ